jgi:hypothetical protein
VRARTTAALMLVFALVGATTAEAAKAPTKIKSVTIQEAGPGKGEYGGKVKSPKAKCEARRKVTVIHDSDPPFVIGETVTDDQGNWKLTGPLPPSGDRIIVKVKKTKKCKGASETYEVVY